MLFQFVDIHDRTSLLQTFANPDTELRSWGFQYVHAWIYVYVYVRVLIRVCVYVYICTHISIRIRICISPGQLPFTFAYDCSSRTPLDVIATFSINHIVAVGHFICTFYLCKSLSSSQSFFPVCAGKLLTNVSRNKLFGLGINLLLLQNTKKMINAERIGISL